MAILLYSWEAHTWHRSVDDAVELRPSVYITRSGGLNCCFHQSSFIYKHICCLTPNRTISCLQHLLNVCCCIKINPYVRVTIFALLHKIYSLFSTISKFIDTNKINEISGEALPRKRITHRAIPGEERKIAKKMKFARQAIK